MSRVSFARLDKGSRKTKLDCPLRINLNFSGLH